MWALFWNLLGIKNPCKTYKKETWGGPEAAKDPLR